MTSLFSSFFIRTLERLDRNLLFTSGTTKIQSARSRKTPHLWYQDSVWLPSFSAYFRAITCLLDLLYLCFQASVRYDDDCTLWASSSTAVLVGLLLTIMLWSSQYSFASCPRCTNVVKETGWKVLGGKKEGGKKRTKEEEMREPTCITLSTYNPSTPLKSQVRIRFYYIRLEGFQTLGNFLFYFLVS